MAEPDYVDQRTLGRVQAGRQAGSDLDRLPTERTSLSREDMYDRRRLKRWNAATARDGDVDAIGYLVGQAVARQSRGKTQRTLRDPVGDLDKGLIGRGSIRQPI
jgi:hypothetical protein